MLRKSFVFYQKGFQVMNYTHLDKVLVLLQ